MKDFEDIKDSVLELVESDFSEYYEESKEAIEKALEDSKDKISDWSTKLITRQINTKFFELLLMSEKDLLTLEVLKQAGIQQLKLDEFKGKLIGLLVEKLG